MKIYDAADQELLNLNQQCWRIGKHLQHLAVESPAAVGGISLGFVDLYFCWFVWNEVFVLTDKKNEVMFKVRRGKRSFSGCEFDVTDEEENYRAWMRKSIDKLVWSDFELKFTEDMTVERKIMLIATAVQLVSIVLVKNS